MYVVSASSVSCSFSFRSACHSMGNISFSQEVVDLKKFHRSACKKPFSCVCPFLSLPLHSLSATSLLPFHSLLREASEKVNISSTSPCCRDWIAPKKSALFLFHVDITDVWSRQILISLHMQVMALAAPACPAPCSGCLNVLWRRAGPCSLCLQSWWRAGRSHAGERSSPSPWVITVTSLELAERQQTWPKRRRNNLYIGLRRDNATAKGAVVLLLSLLDQRLFICGHPGAEKQMPPCGRNQLLPHIL